MVRPRRSGEGAPTPGARTAERGAPGNHIPRLNANFHEKAHFVKGRRGGLGVAERNGFLCPSRYASIRCE